MNVVEDTDEPTQPYPIMPAVSGKATQQFLRPIEWYHLAVLHSPKQFLLHDDFMEGRTRLSYQRVMSSSQKEDKSHHITRRSSRFGVY
ncbi:hypothetical protein ACEQPO_15745 [Bacillus sp. SL00103]